jgi:hypothetical protein
MSMLGSIVWRNLVRSSLVAMMVASLGFNTALAKQNNINPSSQVTSPHASALTNTNNPSSNKMILQKAFTLKSISGTDGALLTGANAMRVFYLPVPPAWKLDNITLQLYIYSSSLLGTPSTLTALVNGNPISTERLDQHFNFNNTWNITIPADLITGSIVNLTINNMLDDFGNNCYNLSSPKFWVFIAGKSIINYNYKVEDYKPDLTQYPFPFVTNPSIEKDSVVVVLPDDPSLEDFTAAFYVTNSLINKSSWLGVNVIATTVGKITDDQKNNHHLIYIGQADQLRLADMQTTWPLTVTPKIAAANGQVVNDETGVLMLSQSPWNAKRALLVITGNSGKAVSKAANMLRNSEFNTTVLFNQYALITQDNEEVNYHADWTDTTLKNLNFPNQFLYGSGQNVMTYDIDLPLNKVIKGVNLSIHYSVSPFISTKDSSFLTLRVNDVPIDGITLAPSGAKINNWNVYIDGNNLHNGKNHLTFIFDLYNKNQHCKPEDTSLVWGTIYNSSTLHLDLENKNPFLNFSMFKTSPYTLTVALPKNQAYFKTLDFTQQVINLSKAMPLMSGVNFIYNDDLVSDQLMNDNVLYIGDIYQNKAIFSLISNIPFYYDQHKLVINRLIKPYVAVSHEIPISINEIIPSPSNPDRLMMIMMAEEDEGFKKSIDIFTDTKMSALIDGNVALVYANGTFTSIKADKIIEAANRKKKVEHNIVYFFISIVLLIILIIVTRKTYIYVRNYFTPKSK